MPRPNTPEDIWARIDKTPSCWLWRGCISKTGYGYMGINNESWLVHRWVYERLVGPIPEGQEIDHLCSVRNCCNPSHLECVTHRENLLRGDTMASRHARKTHCARGHEYTEENTYLWRGMRFCRKCGGRRVAAHYKRKLKGK